MSVDLSCFKNSLYPIWLKPFSKNSFLLRACYVPGIIPHALVFITGVIFIYIGGNWGSFNLASCLACKWQGENSDIGWSESKKPVLLGLSY